MTAQEAIKYIIQHCNPDYPKGKTEWETAMNMAIEALKEQTETSTEIQEILNYLDTTLHPIVSPDNWYVYAELHDMVSMLPSAQPERKKGEWIDKSGGIEGAWNYCSVCGEQAIDLYDFCPNCGADMRGELDG